MGADFRIGTAEHGMSGAIIVEEVTAQDWPAMAAEFSDLTYEQDIAFVTAGARRIGAQVRAFAVRRDGDLIGAACLRIKAVPVLRRGIAYLLAGPMTGRGTVAEAPGRAAVVLTALRTHIVGGEGHLLRLRLPVTAEGFVEGDITRAGFLPTAQTPAYRTVLIDLRSDNETLRKGLHSKWRYELRRAEGEAMEIVTGRSAVMVERFLTLYREMREFKSFDQGFDPAFLRGMADTAFDFEVRIAVHHGVDVGGHVTAFTPACATYLFGATTEAGRTLRAGYALSWDAVTGARGRGARWFDLGGVDKVTNAPGYTFKARTGGNEVSALGPYEAGTLLGGPVLRSIESVYAAVKQA